MNYLYLIVAHSERLNTPENIIKEKKRTIIIRISTISLRLSIDKIN